MNWILALSGWLAFAGLGVFVLIRFPKYIRTEAELAEAKKRIEEQQKTYDESQKKFETTFSALATKALAESSESFLKLATERLDKKTAEARGAFDEKAIEFKKVVDPIRDLLNRVENDISKVEKERIAHYSRISEQLIAVSQSSESLRKEASSLTSALRRPEVRGAWGEIQLRRVVELAGMSSYCDFTEQLSTQTEAGIQRPDMVVHLPNKRMIILDSKAVMDAYLDAVQAETPEKKAEALTRHAKNIRSRVSALSKKSYWEQFEQTPDFCVLFIPNEAFLAAAVEVDRDIIEDALAERIVIATPTTLVALLKAVAYGWQQNQLAENAQKILASAKELYERLGVWTEHIDQVGEKLESAVKSYNSAVGSLESRVLPSARKFNELGISLLEPLPEISPIDTAIRRN